MDGRGMGVDYEWWNVFQQKPDIPLIRFNASYKQHNLSVSYEQFMHCYICPYYEETNGHFLYTSEANREFLPGFVQWRRFNGLSLTYGYDVITIKGFTLTPYIGFYRRTSDDGKGINAGAEFWVEEFIPRISYPEGFYRIVYGNAVYDHLTPTVQLFARYTLFNHLTLSVKADYSRFGDGPKNQLGIGALIGYRW
jgi:hypothetical protein